MSHGIIIVNRIIFSELSNKTNPPQERKQHLAAQHAVRTQGMPRGFIGHAYSGMIPTNYLMPVAQPRPFMATNQVPRPRWAQQQQQGQMRQQPGAWPMQGLCSQSFFKFFFLQDLDYCTDDVAF